MRATVIGIAGCTNAGKSTLSKELSNEILKRKCSVKVIEQDDYYFFKENVKTVQSITDPDIVFYDYDEKDALDIEKLLNHTKSSANEYDFLIVEGSMITDIDKLYEIMHVVIFLTIDKDLCVQRRGTREYDPPDLPGYFEQIVWPSYERTLHHAHTLSNNEKQPKLLLLPHTEVSTTAKIQNMMKTRLRDYLNLLRIQHDVINIDQAIEFTNEPNCGAISTFIGTTRDTFEGKTVESLEYECYEEMAYSELRKLCAQARERFKTIERIVIIHRIGEVKVREASIIIATSSPQRKDAFSATEFLINKVKSTIPIWKKEVYLDGTCSWKENKESIHQQCK